MKFLVIGYGSIGKRHARNIILLGHEVVLLRHSKENPNAEGIKEYYSFDEFLRSKEAVDGAIICSPTSKHLSDVRFLAMQSIPFLLEKPPTFDLRSTYEMIDVIKTHNAKKYDIAFNLRYHPVLQFIHGFLPNVGKIYSTRIYVGYYLPYWRVGVDYRETTSAKKELGGGVHVELAHDIDYALWLIGLPGKLVGYINRISELEISTEDICSAIWMYDNGSILELHLDYLSHKYMRGGEIVAEGGTLEWEWDPSSGKVFYFDRNEKERCEIFSLNSHYDFNNTYLEECKHFVGVVCGERAPKVSITEATDTMKVIEAIRISSEQGKWVTLEEINESKV